MTAERVNPETFSDFVVYADESGDHGLDKIDPAYPVFTLAFVIMRRVDYLEKITPDLQRLKFNFWGHDQVVFHEREIRKRLGPFSILVDQKTNEEFMMALSTMMSLSPMVLCVSTIDKTRLKTKYPKPWSPYEIALHFCMERLLKFLQTNEQDGRVVHVIFESRGKSEDAELELEFRRIAGNSSTWGWRNLDFSCCTFRPVFARKDANAAGLQLADLVARPCALHAMKPSQPNRAYEAIGSKIKYRKVFP